MTAPCAASAVVMLISKRTPANPCVNLGLNLRFHPVANSSANRPTNPSANLRPNLMYVRPRHCSFLRAARTLAPRTKPKVLEVAALPLYVMPPSGGKTAHSHLILPRVGRIRLRFGPATRDASPADLQPPHEDVIPTEAKPPSPRRRHLDRSGGQLHRPPRSGETLYFAFALAAVCSCRCLFLPLPERSEGPGTASITHNARTFQPVPPSPPPGRLLIPGPCLS